MWQKIRRKIDAYHLQMSVRHVMLDDNVMDEFKRKGYRLRVLWDWLYVKTYIAIMGEF